MNSQAHRPPQVQSIQILLVTSFSKINPAVIVPGVWLKFQKLPARLAGIDQEGVVDAVAGGDVLREAFILTTTHYKVIKLD
jgi:hypothetical protein